MRSPYFCLPAQLEPHCNNRGNVLACVRSLYQGFNRRYLRLTAKPDMPELSALSCDDRKGNWREGYKSRKMCPARAPGLDI